LPISRGCTAVCGRSRSLTQHGRVVDADALCRARCGR
jgi:hypothetical protein